MQILAGDLAGALRTAVAVEDERARWRVLLDVGRAQINAGDRKAALATCRQAMKAADAYPEGRANEGGVITLVPAWALIKGSVARQVAAASAEAGGEKESHAWAAGQTSQFVKVMAQLGTVEGVAARNMGSKPSR